MHEKKAVRNKRLSPS